MNPQDEKHGQAWTRLLGIMNELRARCPWDRKQTIESLRHLTIEETYELSDAILQGNLPEIQKELGDLLLHIVFYAKIATEQQAFDISDVINGLCDKLITRHPHVYGDTPTEDEAEIKRSWERIKLQEKGGNSGVLSGVPSSLPALIKAWRIQQKAQGVGFDWDSRAAVWAKVEEELGEFKAHVGEDGTLLETSAATDEFGDLLFTLVNYARFVGIDPETALERTNRRFINRFNHMEAAIKQEGKALPDLKMAVLNDYWNAAKGIYP